MIAASYFLFGDSDFSSRLPHALFGIAVVLFALFGWRRYLGRTGAMLAGLFFMISPYMLFYSRYARNEIFIVFWGLVMLWTFLRYLEGGEKVVDPAGCDHRPALCRQGNFLYFHR